MRILSLLTKKSAPLWYFLASSCLVTTAGIAQPKISGFSPLSAPVGVPLTINGSGFDPIASNNIVYVGGVRASVLNATPGMLVVERIAAGTYAPITVTKDGLTGYSAVPFVSAFSGTEGLNAGSFAGKKEFKVFNASQGGAIVDLDGDGKLDVVMTEAGSRSFVLSVLRNTSTKGRLSFDNKIELSDAPNTFKIAVSDFNGDGKPDLALLSYIGTVYVFRNTSIAGQITFAPFKVITTGLTVATDIKAADLDADGRPEIIAVNLGAMTGRTSVCIARNTSTTENISFAPTKDFIGSTVAIGDVNGDLLPELAINNVVYENKSVAGNLQFSPVFSGVASLTTSLSDVDGDGKNDFVVFANGTNTIYRNKGTNSIDFEGGVQISVGNSALRVADLNGDGRLDFLTASSSSLSSNSLITLNDSKPGSISAGRSLSLSLPGLFRDIQIADMDGDGKQDILANNSDTLSILRNISGDPVILASGNSAVSGEIITNVAVEPVAPVYNNRTYLQKRYDIEPITNASTATATITLAYSQNDFNAYNSNPSHGMDLPANPMESNKKANLRIFQHHGTSATGVPGSYSGSIVEIDPDDSNIIWNDSLRVWQVTFNVEGFSGFFAGSVNALALPAQIAAFNASVSGNGVNLGWTSLHETGVDRFEIERSIDAAIFKKLNTVVSSGANAVNKYSYLDNSPAPVNYYRLKIIDKDGSFTYSQVLKTGVAVEARLTSYPNPATDKLTITVPATERESSLRIISKNGLVVKSFIVSGLQTRIDINVQALAPGSYNLLWSDGLSRLSQTILIARK